MIGLKEATKAFGGTVALRNATFDLRSGEVLALLGENGAGKSTCVKMFAGVYQADARPCGVGRSARRLRFSA